MDEERLARMRMSRVAEPGDPDACRLVREHSARALVERLETGKVTQPKARAWRERLTSAPADALLDVALRSGARFAMPGDGEWPVALADLRAFEGEAGERGTGEPFGLWLRGPLALSAAAPSAVALVGARAATPYGEHVAAAIAAGCAARGRTVVSGGAYGVDAAAHRGALAAGGSTVIVLASGVDRSYPAGNDPLVSAAAESGLVVSEAAPGCPPSRSRFLVRNRLIAALTRGTVVVEAALRSGSLNTARWARDLGRVLMGVPGPVTSMMSAGVHELLRSPEAVLVTDADEVLELVSDIGTEPAPAKKGPVDPRDALSRSAQRVLEATPAVAAAPALAIAGVCGLPAGEVMRALGQLERQGFVVSVADGWRLPPAGPDAP